jgi:hypothetical protein
VIRWSTALAVLGVAAVAAVASYEHAYDLVRAHGEAGWAARLVPLTVDGLIYASSMVMLDSARRKRAVPALARWLLGLGIAATLAANVATAGSRSNRRRALVERLYPAHRIAQAENGTLLERACPAWLPRLRWVLSRPGRGVRPKNLSPFVRTDRGDSMSCGYPRQCGDQACALAAAARSAHCIGGNRMVRSARYARSSLRRPVLQPPGAA